MLRSLFLGGLGAFALVGSSFADDFARPSYPYRLSASAESQRYGIWLVAPVEGCRKVRYVVASGRGRLGLSPTLQSGQGVVIHIGKGFAFGEHALAITGFGCDGPPAEVRRVLLGKASPDHSWLFK